MHDLLDTRLPQRWMKRRTAFRSTAATMDSNSVFASVSADQPAENDNSK